VFVDALGGAALVSAMLEREGMATQEATEWSWAGVLGAGVQVRVFHELSIGARLRLLFADDPLSDLRDQLTIGTPIPVSLAVGATWHF
jgi:molybdopterin/thiamine biosynthesis adenylyltransferase